MNKYKIHKPVVLFDGSCNLCRGNLKWLHRIDFFKVFDDVPYQDKVVPTLFPDIAQEQFEESLHVIFPNGKIYTGFDAFRAVFFKSPWMFFLALLLSIPPLPWLGRKLYPYVAKNRYKIAGQCSLPKK
ncbi:MAG TPA: DUF393 domain-containing protein [Oligoflexia bacterium]|nr:DUF393 domain-containing protein [Oligoflexia bacterium]HMR25087.1 DUF393 domain-containing protein [Oligoflexia bacterium]